MKVIRKVSDWKYVYDEYSNLKVISQGNFYKYTLKHKIRLLIGITGSIDEGYYFYGIHCKDKNFHINPSKYPLKKLYNRICKKFTPVINKTLNFVF